VIGSRGSPAGEQSDLEGEFVTFYRLEYPRAVRLAGLLTGSASAGEDIAQESLMIVRERFDRIDKPPAYLRGVVVNRCRRWHRDNAQRRRGLLRLRANLVTLSGFEPSELADVVAQLPFRQRVVIVGRYWGGWSEAEIAAALGCRPGRVKSLASRALVTLRLELKDLDR
jgi:RNA polymerase sigma factor (sigma-70 family)